MMIRPVVVDILQNNDRQIISLIISTRKYRDKTSKNNNEDNNYKIVIFAMMLITMKTIG